MITKQQINEHISALKEYFFDPIKKIFARQEKINTMEDLEKFIQTKSAIITQHTLYGYLKTRIGTRHVMMFGDEQFSISINIAKWNIYVVSIQDFCLYCFSFLARNNLCTNMDLASDVFYRILDGEKKNGLEESIYQNAIKDFDERVKSIHWKTYCEGECFEKSSYALYRWAPIAEELKKLDKSIVIRSMQLKWDNLKKDFAKLIAFNTLG